MPASRNANSRSHDVDETYVKRKHVTCSDNAADASAAAPIPPLLAIRSITTQPPQLSYPAYCYRDSPTWFKWVSLTAYDIHYNLTVKPQLQIPSRNNAAISKEGIDKDKKNNSTRNNDAPLRLFYLNHPIQFVQVVGVVVTLEDFYESFWLFNIDDSSGAVLEVNCRKPAQPQQNDVQETQKRYDNGGNAVISVPGKTTASAGAGPNQLAQPPLNISNPPKATPNFSALDPDTQNRHTTLPLLQIGTVVHLRGRIATYRHVRQLRLDRISILRSTNEELSYISRRTSFLDSVLSKPWLVTDERKRELYLSAKAEEEEEEKRKRKRKERETAEQEREERHRKRITGFYEAEERERTREAEIARAAGREFERWKERRNGTTG